MKITFKRTKIENFKNLAHLETEFGNKTYIYGANETGKTTFADAISYVLTGKNSLGESQFEFIPIGSIGFSPRVELEIEISDKKGVKSVNLVRMYEAKKKKDGEFTGTYQTVCYVNGLKIGPKEYDKWIEEHICNSEVFRLIHDVRYFTENISTNGKERSWESQRRLLFSICGMKSDIDMAKYKKRFSDIVEGLQQYDNVNQYLIFLKEEEKASDRQITYLNGKISTFYDLGIKEDNNEEMTMCPLCGNKTLKKIKVNTFTTLDELETMRSEELENRAKTRKMIDLTEDFIEMKCKLAQKKVNEMIDGVQVEFFKKNKTNSEIIPCCNIFYNNVPYASLSYSTKFVVSMKIALAFQKFYNILFPLLIDNAESINTDYLDDNFPQTIYLIMIEQRCPDCGGYVGRKNHEGNWKCADCGTVVHKKLNICFN